MSGHALMTLFDGEGVCDQFWLQCHQPLIGAPSPIHANHPCYPTVIFPTTSPAALAASLGSAVSNPAAPRPAPNDAEINTERREMPMAIRPLQDGPGPGGAGGDTTAPAEAGAGQIAARRSHRSDDDRCSQDLMD